MAGGRRCRLVVAGAAFLRDFAPDVAAFAGLAPGVGLAPDVAAFAGLAPDVAAFAGSALASVAPAALGAGSALGFSAGEPPADAAAASSSRRTCGRWSELVLLGLHRLDDPRLRVQHELSLHAAPYL